MKKVLFITSLIVMCQMGWAQKKTVETEEQYRLVRTTDLDKYYDGLLVTPFLCDYVALSNDPVEKTMTFDEINMFDYDLKDRQTV
ncbi:MAG: hypothetical protein LBN27_08830, partial [Prevotellaceae bacterium]|nr:hypothetical protein [Prevotellaceae bacterium]